MALREACDRVKKDRVLEVIRIAHQLSLIHICLFLHIRSQGACGDGDGKHGDEGDGISGQCKVQRKIRICK